MCLFTKRAIGLDIADHTIEIVELQKNFGKVKVRGLGRKKLAAGIVERGRVKKKEELSQAIKDIFSQAKPNRITGKKIVFGLPECQIYTHFFSLPITEKIKEENLRILVEEEAGKNIPIDKKDLLLSHKVLRQSEDSLEILLVAASREVAHEWSRFFRELRLAVDFFDIETSAIFRDLFTENIVKPVCVVDLGAATTNIAIFNQLGLCYSYTINAAGEAFSKEISDILKVSLEEAEQKKIKIGLDKKDKEIYFLLSKKLDEIIEEIKIAVSYIQEKYKENDKIEQVVLVGGSSQLKGLEEYFKSALTGLAVRIGESRLVKSKVPLEYIEAVGLALRGLNKRAYQDEPMIMLDDK